MPPAQMSQVLSYSAFLRDGRSSAFPWILKTMQRKVPRRKTRKKKAIELLVTS